MAEIFALAPLPRMTPGDRIDSDGCKSVLAALPVPVGYAPDDHCIAIAIRHRQTFAKEHLCSQGIQGDRFIDNRLLHPHPHNMQFRVSGTRLSI